jgi:hypothetical protein
MHDERQVKCSGVEMRALVQAVPCWAYRMSQMGVSVSDAPTQLGGSLHLRGL